MYMIASHAYLSTVICGKYWGETSMPIVIEQGITVGPGIAIGPGSVSAANGSLSFSGSNYLSVAGGIGTAMGTSDFTWECWVRPTGSTGYQTFIDTRTAPLGGGDTNGFYFGTDTGTLVPIVYTTSTILSASANLTLNTWSHVALTRSSGNLTIWIGGLNRGNLVGDTTNLTEQKANIGGSGGLYLSGQMSFLRMIKGTAQYTANFTPSTSTLRPIAGTQLLLPLVATPFTDISTNEFTVTNNGTITTTAQAPTLTAVTTDLTGTYTVTKVNTANSLIWSTGVSGAFGKLSTSGVDLLTGGPIYTGATQSYTVFMAYNVTTIGAGRLLNTGIESNPADWLMGSYGTGAGGTGYKNVLFSGGTGFYNVDTYTSPSGWRFIWGTYDNASGNLISYIASATENNTVGPTDFYKYNNGMSGAHGFNQLRLFSRGGAAYTSTGVETQTGNVGLVRVYDGAMPIQQIQSVWANLHARFGI
jgi:hypothetical protein